MIIGLHLAIVIFCNRSPGLSRRSGIPPLQIELRLDRCEVHYLLTGFLSPDSESCCYVIGNNR